MPPSKTHCSINMLMWVLHYVREWWQFYEPDSSQMPPGCPLPRCIPDASQMSPISLPDASQMPPRRFPDGPRCPQDLMKINDNQWKVDGNQWESNVIIENPWKSSEDRRTSVSIKRKSKQINDNQWKANENLWKSMRIKRNNWKSMKIERRSKKFYENQAKIKANQWKPWQI